MALENFILRELMEAKLGKNLDSGMVVLARGTTNVPRGQKMKLLVDNEKDLLKKAKLSMITFKKNQDM
jgi:hypothetical protein